MRIDSAIQAEFREKRARALKEHEARMAALYERSPMLRTLDESRSLLIYERGLALLRAKDDAGRAAAREASDAAVAEIDRKRLKLLSDIGVAEEELSPRFECERCSDTGYTDKERTIRCACFENRLIWAAFAGSNLNGEERFEAFRTDIYENERQKALTLQIKGRMEAYADSFPENAVPNILLVGAPGLSKSFLLNCTGRRVMERGHSVLKVTASTLLSDYLRYIREHCTKLDYMTPELLIIDDIGTEPLIDNITREYLLSIVNDRLCASKPILAATNVALSTLLSTYGDRLVSRLTAPRSFTVLKLEGGDVRRRL